jgi:hypothetical protein
MNLALGGSMRDADHPKVDELERLLNDPEVPLQAARVWELLAEISGPKGVNRAALDGADRAVAVLAVRPPGR